MIRTRLAAIAAAASLTIVAAACGSSDGDTANNAGFDKEALSENDASASNYVDGLDALENRADAIRADGEEAPPVPRKRP